MNITQPPLFNSSAQAGSAWSPWTRTGGSRPAYHLPAGDRGSGVCVLLLLSDRACECCCCCQIGRVRAAAAVRSGVCVLLLLSDRACACCCCCGYSNLDIDTRSICFRYTRTESCKSKHLTCLILNKHKNGSRNLKIQTPLHARLGSGAEVLLNIISVDFQCKAFVKVAAKPNQDAMNSCSAQFKPVLLSH